MNVCALMCYKMCLQFLCACVRACVHVQMLCTTCSLHDHSLVIKGGGHNSGLFNSANFSIGIG